MTTTAASLTLTAFEQGTLAVEAILDESPFLRCGIKQQPNSTEYRSSQSGLMWSAGVRAGAAFGPLSPGTAKAHDDFFRGFMEAFRTVTRTRR